MAVFQWLALKFYLVLASNLAQRGLTNASACLGIATPLQSISFATIAMENSNIRLQMSIIYIRGHLNLRARLNGLYGLLMEVTTLSPVDPNFLYPHFTPKVGSQYYNMDGQVSHRHQSAPIFVAFESSRAYFLVGELPGVESKEDIIIKWLN